jgi:hypothetical protein
MDSSQCLKVSERTFDFRTSEGDFCSRFMVIGFGTTGGAYSSREATAAPGF